MVRNFDVHELESELSKTRSKFEEWVVKLQRNAVDIRDSHAQNMSDQSVKMESLKARRVKLESQAQGVKERVAKEEAEASALQEDSTSHQIELEKLKLQLANLEAEIQSEEAQYQQQEAAASVSDNSKKKKLSALRRALDLYSSRLGLTFKQGNDELQLIFTQISRKHPLQECIINVKISAENTYNVTKSEPPIPKLPELLQKLNQDNNFSAFVKDARTEFVAMSE